jgi:hypothetical protein
MRKVSMKPNDKKDYYKILILLLGMLIGAALTLQIITLTSCQKPESKPETYCYECTSNNYQAVQTFCGVSADTMQYIIEWRKKNLKDTLECEKKGTLNLIIH